MNPKGIWDIPPHPLSLNHCAIILVVNSVFYAISSIFRTHHHIRVFSHPICSVLFGYFLNVSFQVFELFEYWYMFNNWAGMYYIEYTLRNPGESERHLYSVLGIANNGWYNRLYTLTGQVRYRHVVMVYKFGVIWFLRFSCFLAVFRWGIGEIPFEDWKGMG